MNNPNGVPQDELSLGGRKILFAVLNWGLGHATRSEVIIKALLSCGAEVHIASDGDALRVLKRSFPEATFHELPEYQISYRAKGNLRNLLFQVPRIWMLKGKEKKCIRELQLQHKFDGLISDNRPFSHLKGLPSAYISHQLQLRAGWVSFIANRVHRRLWTRYSEVWVPDFETRILSGELSKGNNARIPVRFTGPLSRLKMVTKSREIPWAAVLSGPEPLRSEWEAELLEMKPHLPQGGLIIQGKPEAHSEIDGVINYLDKTDLNQLYADASVIICRSGYSTIMDLWKLGKRAILIPTPGQSEQLYLAELHHGKSWISLPQNEADYAQALMQLENVEVESDPRTESKFPMELFRLFQGERES